MFITEPFAACHERLAASDFSGSRLPWSLSLPYALRGVVRYSVLSPEAFKRDDPERTPDAGQVIAATDLRQVPVGDENFSSRRSV
jgi:hypothetical protein